MSGKDSRRMDPDLIEQSSVDRAVFTDAMAAVANSVAVVTTAGPGGRYGQTVSSFCSASADPPQMLFCLHRKSPARAAIEINQRFSINILPDHRYDIADVFAGRPGVSTPYFFREDDWEADALGCASARDATAVFSCLLETQIDAGTHRIYVGRVIEARAARTSPLLYRDRMYGRYTST